MGKTTEKIINYWLVYWVESKEWLQWYQSGFRREGGTSGMPGGSNKKGPSE